jgi:hypothetical protein
VKSYPLEIDAIYEFEGGSSTPLYYRTKGHHNPTAFCEAFAHFSEDLMDTPSVPPVHAKTFNFEPEEVKHEWHRNVPEAGMSSVTTIHTAKEGSRGAYPVTLVYC